MQETALVYSENELGQIDGKVTNGLVRHSGKYKIVGVVDSSKKGLDAGEYLDGIKNGIPVFGSLDEAIELLDDIPNNFIYGIAPLESFLNKDQRMVIIRAMQMGMNIVNGLPEFLSEDEEFKKNATRYSVTINDIRKPPARKDLHIYSGRIRLVKTPIITVFGTDCAVGKRTTAVKLVEALIQNGINAVFISTGQTGILQGSKYGIAIDVLSSGFSTGEVENAILQALENEKPDIIIVEGQGALSHPAFTSSCAIVRGAMPHAYILQHPPRRVNHCDYPEIPMPSLESEIDLIESFSKSSVVAITLNHEDMTDEEVNETVVEYEKKHMLPTTDVLKHGCDKLINTLFKKFPILSQKRRLHVSP